jgi:biopolymer transport protein ExbD
MKRRARAESKQDIDMSPLIDMVFILLIFFVVSTTFTKDMKIDIDRPGAASASPASTKSMRIFLESNGNITIDGNRVRAWMVQSRVKEFLDASGEGSILVVTDRAVAADKLIEVVDQARLAGATQIGVATEKEAGG